MRLLTSSAGPVRWLLTAGALGAGFGCVEALVRVVASASPSVLRRAPGLVATSGLFYGIAGGIAGLVLFLLLRPLARRRGEGRTALLDAVAAGLLVAGLLAPIALHLFREFVPGEPRWVAWAGLAVVGVAHLAIPAILVAVLLRSSRPAVPLGRIRGALTLAGAGLFALALVLCLITGGPTGLSLTTPEPEGPGAGGGEAPPPNFVVIMIDTLRADHLSAYGSTRAATPRLDALAGRGVLFENSYAPTSWTTPSVVSLLTSRYPSEHGVTDFEHPAPRTLPILPGLLAARGYATSAVVGNPLLHHAGGFDRGYGLYDTYPGEIERSLTLVSVANNLIRGLVRLPLHNRVRLYPRLGLAYPPRFRVGLSDYVRGDEITDLALDVLDRMPDAPFFLYLHYGDPHTPYLNHPFGFLPDAVHVRKNLLDAVIDRYNGEVAYTDLVIGRLLDGLEARGLTEKTVVVFIADHGEEFLEHGVWEHGHNLHEQSLHVPIFLAGPGVPEGERRTEPVDLLDVAPTILALAGAPDGPGFRGRDLLGEELARGAPRPLLSQLGTPKIGKTDQVSILAEGWRYTRHRDREGNLELEELFDRSVDPEELNNLGAYRPERLEAMRRILAGLEAGLVVAADEQEAQESEKEREERLERLRSLGYVD